MTTTAPTTEQTDFTFVSVEKDDVRIGVLISILHGQSGWITAEEIAALHHSATGIRWSERLVRDLASHSAGDIASSQSGYRLTKYLSAAEKESAINRLKSQAREMQRRADEIHIVWLEHQP